MSTEAMSTEAMGTEAMGTEAMSTEAMSVRHPAKFPKRVIKAIDRALDKHFINPAIPRRLLDPFLGVGGIAEISGDWEIHGVEIEPEWGEQAAAKGVITCIGDSRDLPYPDEHFGVICTAPANGNRLADAYAPDMNDPKNRMRRSYRIYLGRPLSPGNGAGMTWLGRGYHPLHARVWDECVRVLCAGGLLVLNIKYYRQWGSIWEGVPRWHRDVLCDRGLELLEEVKIPLGGRNLSWTNHRARSMHVIDHEMLYVFRKPSLSLVDHNCDLGPLRG